MMVCESGESVGGDDTLEHHDLRYMVWEGGVREGTKDVLDDGVWEEVKVGVLEGVLCGSTCCCMREVCVKDEYRIRWDDA